MTSEIDAISSELLRTLLHRQDFQRLEALWRATEGLINEEGGDEHDFFWSISIRPNYWPN
nr:type VI secretion system contractile sheath large subunit [Methylomarinum sp. Ch1-1]MDP4521858.1 type VI secretion system contractile sheath large subunit [Methylomarinum sp. Ch1-1]